MNHFHNDREWIFVPTDVSTGSFSIFGEPLYSEPTTNGENESVAQSLNVKETPSKVTKVSASTDKAPVPAKKDSSMVTQKNVVTVNQGDCSITCSHTNSPASTTAKGDAKPNATKPEKENLDVELLTERLDRLALTKGNVEAVEEEGKLSRLQGFFKGLQSKE